MVKHPIKPFNEAAQGQSDQSNLQNPFDLNPPRDKGNTDHAPKPPRLALSSDNGRAPRGAIGTQRGLSSSHGQEDGDPRDHYPESDGWVHGSIATMQGYGFSVKMSDLPARDNMNGGTIERMVIYRDKTPVANFDRGWNVPPTNTRDKQAVEKVRDVFDPSDRALRQTSSHEQDKDRGRDR